MSSYQSGIYVPRLTPINKMLLIICGGFFILQSILKLMGHQFLDQYLGLSLHMVSRGFVSQLLTYPLVQTDFFSFLFNALVVWFIGSELEDFWGGRRYFKFLLWVVIGSGLSYLGFTLILDSRTSLSYLTLKSLQGFTYGLLMAYGIIFRDRLLSFMMIFPMKAKYFCMLLVGIELYMGLFSSQYGHAAWGHLGAFLMASLFLYLPLWSAKWQLSSARRSSSRSMRRSQSAKGRGSLYLVPTDQDEGAHKSSKNKSSDDDKDSGPGGPKYWH